MHAHQRTFYTTLRREIQGKRVKDWLIGHARDIGIHGVTVIAGIEGYGHDRRVHAAHVFEVADEPIRVLVVMGAEHKHPLLRRLAAAQADVFYVVQAVKTSELRTDTRVR